MNYKKVYKEMFSIQNYNSDHSVSYSLATKFLKEIESTNEISTISDIGSGKGHLIKRLPTEKKIYSYDLQNFLDKELKNKVTFSHLDLSDATSLNKITKTDILFCLDVLEHLEEKYVEQVLRRFSKSCDFCFLTIANHSDIIGGVELHLIQEGKEYWSSKISKYFDILSIESEYNNRLIIYGLRSSSGE